MCIRDIPRWTQAEGRTQRVWPPRPASQTVTNKRYKAVQSVHHKASLRVELVFTLQRTQHCEADGQTRGIPTGARPIRSEQKDNKKHLCHVPH
jgi:hypothetical protein